MNWERLISEIKKHKTLPENIDEYFNSFSNADAFGFLCVTRGLEISSPADLFMLDKKLEMRLEMVKPELEEIEFFADYVISTISEDAFSLKFDEDLIRAALFLGFYPMSMKIDVLNVLSIRFHNKKCLITPETFRIPHNVRKLIEKKFGNYKLTFNRAFRECLDSINECYPETWLCPELTEILIHIHENPDSKISVDSVEIWNGDKLVAGEIGFITGNSYASLTGFHKENDIGNLQMALLGKYLFDNGFAYWDLGMSIPYKYRYGATDNNRVQQTEYWNRLEKNRISFPENYSVPLSSFLEKDFAEYENKDEPFDPEKIIAFPEPNTKYSSYGRQICEITESIPLQLLYSAYMQGVFPWFSEKDKEPVTWYSTDPRFVLFPGEFHCPDSLRRFLKKTPYTYTMDKCFRRVMKECAAMKRPDQDGTWIGQKMIDAYTKLHKAGYAHSFEVWHKGKLAGGFYGVLIGSVFCGESMFTIEPDSSKSAFALFMKAFTECGGIIVDSQSYTDNMARYGARNINRTEFLKIEKEALYKPLEKDLRKTFESIVNSYSKRQ